MNPDSIAALVVAVAAAVVLAVVTAFGWDRLRGRLRWVVRPVAIALCLLSALSAAGIAVNREIEVYTAWGDLFSTGPGGAVAGGKDDGAGDLAGLVPGLPDTSISPTGSRVVSVMVNGRASGMSLGAYVYLPPGYESPALRAERLPVIEALDGFPGSPSTWIKALEAPRILDAEIAAHRMAPTVVVFPYQTPNYRHDTECVDAVGGLKADTFLTTDVRAAITAQFRVRTDAAGWGLVGYSAGAFCAVNLALRHPDKYAAAASLSGYFHALTDSTTGDLYRGSAAARNENSPIWRVQSLPVPRLALYLAAAKDDTFEYGDMRKFTAVARSPLRITTQTLPQGGHTRKVWKALEPPAFDWLSSWLAAPAATT